jgi:L-threonylcarbamoyladenylate synthase
MIISKEDLLENKEFYIKEMREGKIFIYPTDTIYGIGCDSSIGTSVQKIRRLKKRDLRPFSVIVPSLEWIRKNCYVTSLAEKWLEKLPGPYTLILELRNWEAVHSSVNEGRDNLGVRIPDNWFTEIIKELCAPFVTTSVNLSGQDYIKSIDEISESIKKDVDYIVDDGNLDGKPSSVVRLIGYKEEILRK